jgi:hypothetical protein
MFSGADFIYLLTDKFTGLRGGGLTFALILARTFDSLFLGHRAALEFAGEVVAGCGAKELQEFRSCRSYRMKRIGIVPGALIF